MKAVLTSLVLMTLLAGILSCSHNKRVVLEPKKDVKVYDNNKLIASLSQKWSTIYFSAIGEAPIPPGRNDDPVGRSLARDAALVHARTALYGQLGKVHVTEEITVLNATVKSLRVSKMHGTLKAADIIEDRWDDSKKLYIISLKMPQTEIVGYVKEWLDDGTVDPNALDAFIGR